MKKQTNTEPTNHEKGATYEQGGKYWKGGMESDKKCCGGYYKEGGIFPDFNKVVSFKDLFTK